MPTLFARDRGTLGRIGMLVTMVALVVTCNDLPFEPGMEVTGSLDVKGLMETAQDTPIPIDSLVIELRRTSDSTVVYSRAISVDSISVSADGETVSVDIRVNLSERTEQFYLYLAVVGDGEIWFVVRTIVTATAGSEPTVTDPIEPSYVGPGHDATDVFFSLSDTTITGGDSILVTGSVYDGDASIDGALVWFESSDTNMVPTPNQVGRNQAWVLAPAALTDSVRITAVAPTADGTISTTGMLHFFARPDTLKLISGDNQQIYPGAVAAEPLVVQVVDAAGYPFTRGMTVAFDVTSGPENTSVNPTSAVTDSEGYAATELTAGDDVGPIQVTATAAGLSTQTVTFGATVIQTVGAANIEIDWGNNQTATVGTAVTETLAVYVSDGAGNPAPDEVVTFAVASGGGSVTGAVDTTAADGHAQLGSWVLGSTAGINTLTATVAGLPSVTFTATGTPDVADTVVVVSGNNQTADAGTVLPLPLVIEVQDQYGNTLTGELVSWQALNGSVTPASGTTDDSGRAETTWTLGSNSTSQTASASIGSLAPAVFSATATFPTPTILLGLVGADRVSVGSTADLQVTLTAPAGVGGVTVTVTSDNTGVVDVQAPGTVTIAEGNNTGQITLDGVAGGFATVRANATGYAEGTLVVESSLQVLSLPQTLNVPFGGTASLPLTISTPAPSGGETVTLISSDPASVALQATTVTIPEGSYTANATVLGVAPGTSTVTATSATHGSAQSIVSTTANLNIVASSLGISESFGDTITIRLESGGSQIAAPAGGIAVTITSADPTCAIATSPVTIPAGLVDITSVVSYGGSAATTCNTTLTATATDITSDDISVRVDPPPGISMPTSSAATASGLQRYQGGSLGASNHGGVDVVITSSNPSLVLLSPDDETEGNVSLTMPVADGNSSFSYYIHGLEGVTGEVTVTASAPGFTDGTTTVTVVQPGVEIEYLNPTTTSLSDDDPFYTQVGIPGANDAYVSTRLAVRAGAPGPLTVTLASSNPLVGQLTTTQTTGGTVTVEIAEGLYYSPTTVAAGGVAFDPLDAGTTTVSASIPGYISTDQAFSEITVSAPAINLRSTTTASGLQRARSNSLGASNHGGVDVVITSSDPSVLLLSPDDTTAGTASITVPVADGSSSFTYYAQGMEAATGSVSVTATAPGFTDSTTTVDVVQPGIEINGLSTSATSLSADDPFYVQIGIPSSNNAYVSTGLSVRAGAPDPVTATVVSSDPAVGQLVTTPTTGESVTVQIVEGISYSPTTVADGGVAFDPLDAGTTTVSASVPGFITTDQASYDVSVTAPAINLSSTTTASGLQRSRSASLDAGDHGGVDVVIASADPSVLLLSPDDTTAGTASITVPVTDGNTSFTYYVQGVEEATGTVEVTATAPGFTPDTTTTDVVQPGLEINGLLTTTTSLSDDDPFYVDIGIPSGTSYVSTNLAIRAGAPGPLTVTLVSDNPTVGLLETSTLQAGTVDVEIAVGSYRSPTAVVDGGAAFDPLTAGVTNVSASIPGYIATNRASVDVTVSAPGITLTSYTTASGLQRSNSGSLDAEDHGGVDVVITSSNPSVLLLSPDANTAGTETVTVPVTDGNRNFYYYVQGVEGATGTVTVTATASGFTDGTTPTEVVQPAVEIYSSSLAESITTLSPDDPFYARVGIPYGGNTRLQTILDVRAGAPNPLTTSLISSNSSVGRLVTTTVTGGNVTVEIAEGESNTPTTVAEGGVAFEPLTEGSTTVSVSISGFIATDYASREVTVTASGMTLSDATVGAGLQLGSYGTLEGADHGGVDVVITSSDPSVLLVSPDETTPGTSAMTVPVADGSTRFDYYVQGLEGQTGTATITVTATGFTNGTATKVVVQPALTLYSLYTTMTTTQSDDPFSVRVGIPDAAQTSLEDYQEVRAGAPSAHTATVTSSDAGVGQLVTSTSSGGSVTVQISAGEYYSPSSVAGGGVAFDPLAVGTTTVTATIPGFVTLPASGGGSIDVTVTTP